MADESGAGDSTEQGAAGRWLTIAQAARALGVTERAVRRRIERGTLEMRRDTSGNRVRTLVRVPDAEPVPHGGAGQRAGADAERVQDVKAPLAERDVQIARLEERLAAAEAARAELREQVAALKEELHREMTEGRAERARLLALLEAALAERRERRPWPGLRRWLRRAWEGEGG